MRTVLGLLIACGAPEAPVPAVSPCEETTWYRDADGDGWGGDAAMSCEVPGDGWVLVPGDCDDADPRRSPGLPERCDDEQLDDNCDGFYAHDGAPHDAVDKVGWYVDADGDGYGAIESVTWTCGAPGPEATIPVGGDCDDETAWIHPGAEDPCPHDRVDEDCDGSPAMYQDADGDGYGSSHAADCAAPMAWNRDDCDDEDPVVNPSTDEVCGDGIDQDCDGNAGACGIEGRYRLDDPSLAGALAGAGDFDGDGWTDLATQLYGATHLHRGPFAEATGDGLARPWAVLRTSDEDVTALPVLLDFDGDGRTDVASARAPGTHVVHVVDGAHAVAFPRTNPTGVIDSDGDGRDELLVSPWSGPTAHLVVGDPGAGTWTADDVAVARLDVERPVDIGDVDGDGLSDLAWPTPGGAGVALGPLRGDYGAMDGDIWLGHASASPAHGILVGRIDDLDGDGRADLAVTWCDAPGSCDVYLVQPLADRDLADADAVVSGTFRADPVGDLDADGASELLVSYDPETAVLIAGPFAGMVDPPERTRATIEAPFGWVVVAGGHDLNGDGWIDLAVSGTLLFGGPGW